MAGIMLVQGSAQHLSLQDKSIHCALFSPPYFNLRQYENVMPEYWPGGTYRPSPGASPIKVEAETTCLGNEHTVQAYVWHMLLVLREVRRTLRDDGTCWICLGDGYATNPGNGRGGERVDGGIPHRSGSDKTGQGYPPGCLLGIPWLVAHAAIADGWVLRDESVWWKDAPMPESVKGSRHEKARCACLKSNRVYSGMQSQVNGRREHPHGGYTEAFPATVPDPACPHCHGTGRLEEWVLRKGAWRHTRATESVFMLSKTMNYWSDSEAVREAAAPETPMRYMYPFPAYHDGNADPKGGGFRGAGGVDRQHSPSGRNPRNTLHEPPSAAADLRALMQWLQAEAPEVLDAYREAQTNPGNVLRPQASGHGLAHYASFPPSLIEPLIKASCPAQCCPVCGDGWAPLVLHEDIDRVLQRCLSGQRHKPYGRVPGSNTRGVPDRHATVNGYAPTCTHYCTCAPATTAAPCLCCGKLPLSAFVPGLICDPFAGTSTTAEVARALGRRSVMLDPSWTYIHDLSRQRLGLDELAAWQGEKPPPPPETYDDLPLFAPITSAPAGLTQ
jgi:DNA modification methylase